LAKYRVHNTAQIPDFNLRKFQKKPPTKAVVEVSL